MGASKVVRKKTDQVAVATQGRVTTQIEFQDSSDKSRLHETDEDVPRILSTAPE